MEESDEQVDRQQDSPAEQDDDSGDDLVLEEDESADAANKEQPQGPRQDVGH